MLDMFTEKQRHTLTQSSIEIMHELMRTCVPWLHRARRLCKIEKCKRKANAQADN